MPYPTQQSFQRQSNFYIDPSETSFIDHLIDNEGITDENRIRDLVLKRQQRTQQPLQQPQEEQDPSFFGAIGDSARERAGNIADLATNQRNQSFGGAARSGLRGVGQVAGFAGDVVGAGLETLDDATGEVVSGAFQKLIEPIANSEIAQKAYGAFENFRQQNPEGAKDIEAIFNILSVLPTGKAGQLAARGVGKATKSAFRGAGKSIKGIGDTLKDVGRFGVKQATGLEGSTIKNIVDSPQNFTKQAVQQVDRSSLAGKFKGALDERISDLGDLGKGYQSIREGGHSVKVPKNFIEDNIKKNFGLDVEDGIIKANTKSVTRNEGDIKSVQNLYNNWKGRTDIDADEFLNLRSDLSELSRFDSTKTKASDTIGKSLRKDFDTLGKGQIKGLKELDAEYAPEVSLLRGLRKELIDKDGTLKPNAISKIANSTNKGKEKLISKLKEIDPDIEEKVKYVKALEDIELVQESNKVGNYVSSLLGGGGVYVAGGGGFPAIAGGLALFLGRQPKIAVPLIATYGRIASIPKSGIKSLQDVFKKGLSSAKNTNQLTSQQKQYLSRIADKFNEESGGKILDISKASFSIEE